MADFKLVKVIGIHSRESFHAAGEVEAAWTEAIAHPAFVAAALYQGGHEAPLSGQTYHLMRVTCVELPAPKKRRR